MTSLATTITLLSAVLTVAAQSIQHQINLDLEETRILREILRDVIIKINITDTALFMSDFSPGRNSITDSIVKLAMNNAPMNCMASNPSRARRLRPRCHTSSRTLLLYIYKSKDLSSFLDIRDLSYILLDGSRHPKLLFVSLLDDEDADFEALLRFMWTQKLLDVAILEIPRSPSLPFVVHQYNPFTKTYTSQIYSSTIDWFPNKLGNLHGYPIRVDVVLRPGYNTVFRNSQGYVVKYRGHDYRALRTLREAMNFTVISIPANDSSLIKKDEPLSGDLHNVITGRADTLLTTLPLIPEAKEFASATESFGVERWCVLMPVVYKRSGLDYVRLLRILLSLIVIVVIWLVCTVLRFESQCWKILNILGMILSSTLFRFKIVRTSERVLFVSLVLAAAICSTSLYADITTTSIGTPVEIQVETWQDLMRHGLTPILQERLVNITIEGASQKAKKLREKVMQVNRTYDCGMYLLKKDNAFCFMECRMARVVIAMKKRTSNKPLMINTKLCHWTPPNGYYFSKYSPYLPRVSDIMVRVMEAGLTERWFMDYFDDMKAGYLSIRHREPREYENKGMKTQIFGIITCGYVLSILVFVGELVVHRWKRSR